MKIIGLTGGIGTGKSRVLNQFKSFGVPCYEADKVAKKLIKNDQDLSNKIKSIFGIDIYNGNDLDSKKLANLVFKDETKLAALNAIVHPRVALDFKLFTSKQMAPYVIKEAAILIESGAYKNCDLIILVTAPKSDRLKRVIKRDGLSVRDVMDRMETQWKDEKKIPFADFVIENNDWEKTTLQIEEIYRQLSS
ncbi:MAG: dephospho-CoA kinase [Flavobacteriales bacterium TMED235]|nr:MAG: dephospho-CoA kinase [Flavobacteriales bacterium TMED235]|tara:strand:- start:521 stop:1099 length:579 start_codon:yes stop_codon:yes gene_type:complete